jgi:hypothetical protein
MVHIDAFGTLCGAIPVQLAGGVQMNCNVLRDGNLLEFDRTGNSATIQAVFARTYLRDERPVLGWRDFSRRHGLPEH